MALLDTSPRSVGAHDVGPIGFGCWRFVGMETDRAAAVLETALDHGMTLVDTADVYGLDWGGDHFGQAEELLGDVLQAHPSLRDRMVLATKGGILPPLPYDSSGNYLRQALEASLRRLRVDHIDLYQIHRPDLLTHPAEVAATLDQFIDEGLVGSVGVSNHTAAQTRALNAHLRAPLATTQPQFSALHLDALRDGTLDLAMEAGITPLAWSPLGGGRLATGEGVRTELIEALDRIADREDTNRSAVALAFVLAHPSRPVAIIGSQNPDRIAAAPAALSVHLDRNDWYDIVEASEGVPLP